MAAVGTLTITKQAVAARERPVRKYTLAWTSSAGGAVSGILTDYISGVIVRVVFIPGAGGSAPTALYDIVLLDENAIDVLAGQGANLSATVTSHVVPGVPFKDGTTTGESLPALDDLLELQVSNAGNAKSGTVVLYVL